MYGWCRVRNESARRIMGRRTVGCVAASCNAAQGFRLSRRVQQVVTNQRAMSDLRVSSWNELQEQLFADTWNEQIQRFRSNFAYRGIWDAGDNLSTSITRLGLGYERQEVHMLR